MQGVRFAVSGSYIPVMPFLMASTPVRKGSIGSLRRNAAALDAPMVGSLGPLFQRLSFTAGEMDRIVRRNRRDTEGQRKRGGTAKAELDGLGGILV